MEQEAYTERVGYPVQFSVDYRHLDHRQVPKALFGFVEGVIRWNIRVTAYTLTLVTDRYPPFRLAP
jgi:hypothetical protein